MTRFDSSRAHRFALTAVALTAPFAATAQAQDGLVGADFPAAKYATLPNADGFDVTDVDGDGIPDLVSASRLQPVGVVSVLFGRPDGTFEAAVRIEVPVRPQDAAAIDLDGDGDQELIVTSRDGDLIFLAENLGGRTFGTLETLAVADSPRDIAIVDADGDGQLDVLVGSLSPAQILVFLADGVGGLAAAPPLSVVRTPDHIEVGDVDGDGRVDILVAAFNASAFDLLLGVTGGFAPPTTVDAGSSARATVLRDGTGDGVLDIAFVEWFADGVYLMPGNGDGTFGASLRTEVGQDPYSIEVADLNADGTPDFLVTRSSTFGQIGGRLVIVEGDPISVFGSNGPALRTGSNPRMTAARDFDGDGNLDVAALNNIGGDIAILRGRGDLTLEVPSAVPVALQEPECVVSGDFTGDGTEDLLVCDSESGTMIVYVGDGDGGFSQGASSGSGVFCFVARTADLDLDGDLDVLVQGRRNGFPGELAVALNDGSGSFSVSDRLPHDQETARQLEVGDLNGDGIPDIVTTGSFSSVVTWIGQGDGTFVQGPNGTGFQSARFLDLGDVNADGHLDVVAVDTADRRIDTYLGDGTGQLTLTLDTATNLVGAGHLRLGDVTGDGVDDVVLSAILVWPDEFGIAVFEGLGDGTFVSGPTRDTRNAPTELALLDVDLDGDSDIVVVSSTAVSDVEVVENLGSGALGDSILYSGSLDASAVAIGDFDANGNPDLALASPNAREITVLINRADVRLNSYCTPFANSTGVAARLTAEGSRSLSANDLRLVARDMPAGESVIWFAGAAAGSRLLFGANLCIAGPLQRISMPSTVDATGGASLQMAFTPLQLVPGDTWYFQTWFTDPAGAAPHFNFTDGLAVLLRP